MSAEAIKPRKRIHEAIQASRAGSELDGAVLVGWVTVAEWMSPDGERWITCASGESGGESAPAVWRSEGLLHHALNGDWSRAKDLDDE